MKNIIIKFICQILELKYHDELMYYLRFDEHGSDLMYEDQGVFDITSVLNEKLNQKMLDLFNYFDTTYNTSPARTTMIQITPDVIMIFIEGLDSGILYNTIDRKLYEQI